MSKLITRVLAPGAILAMFGALSVQAQQQAAAPAQSDEPAAQAALPTTGDGAAIVKLLTGVCKPSVEGRGLFDDLVKSNGLTKAKDSEDYVMPLSQRPYQISVHKPSNQNLTTCELRVTYAPGWDQPIIDALNTWRFLHSPQLHMQRSQIATYKDAKRTTMTWDNWENQGDDGIMAGLTFNKIANPDGTPIVRGAETAVISYQVRTPLPEMVASARQRKADAAKAQADYEKAKADYDKQMADYQAQLKAAQDAQAAQAAQQAQQATQAAQTSAADAALAAQYQAALGNQAAPK